MSLTQNPAVRTFAQHRDYFMEGYESHTMAVLLALVMRMSAQCRPGVPFSSFNPYIDLRVPDFHLTHTNGNAGSTDTMRPGYEWSYPF